MVGFWSLFAWNIFFQPFTFSLYVSPVLRWVSCRQHMYPNSVCCTPTGSAVPGILQAEILEWVVEKGSG